MRKWDKKTTIKIVELIIEGLGAVAMIISAIRWW